MSTNGSATLMGMPVTLELGLASAGAILGGVLGECWRRHRRQVAHQVWLDGWPSALRSYSGQLRASSGLEVATQSLAQALGRSDWDARRQDGLRWSQVLLAEQDQESQVLGQLVAHHEEHGFDLAASVDRFADRLTQAQRAASLGRIAVAPVLAQARMVLFVMPVMVALVGVFEPGPTLKLFTTYRGLGVLGLCCALNLGIWIGFRKMAHTLR